ncbi:LytTR family DNA-binding domain-containing protein [Anaerovibrio lipolyticus]|uniref:LytR/AlgR family response regulator transcription factor n=1 Tax=Anaerovibrio lipolyticus TaxID=82374 RepID=UPI0023F18188|nr:LytTR family DNA-binding domain-containing protein [Anaerovibrio lipolyticus]
MLRTVIVDDEQPICDDIAYLLEAHPDIEVVATFQQSQQALAYLQQNPCDLLFLDIKMPGMSGLEFAECLSTLKLNVMIIFVTAYEEYALPAFETSAVAYLTKPLGQARLTKALKKVRSLFSLVENNESTGRTVPAVEAHHYHPISVQKGEALIPVQQRDILLAYVKEKLVFLRTKDGDFQLSMTLAELEELLDPELFLRVHRQYIVNTEAIAKVIPWFHGSYVLNMKDGAGTEIPVSRKHISEVRQVLGIK